MDFSRITGSTTALEHFLSEWSAPGDCITAHTSGSTGAPKSISLKKADMRVSARMTCRQFGLDSSAVLGLPLSVDYIAGKMMVVRALEANCRLVVEEPSMTPLATLAPSLTLDLVSVVPAQVEGVLAAPCRVKRLLVGGAPLSAAGEKQLLASGVEAYVTYGMTETCSNVALRRVGTDLYRANPGFEFGTDGRGCLEVSSSLMSFGRLTTNDLVELAGPDSFRWLGRADNVINSGGVKVCPEQVEASIAALDTTGSLAGHFYVTSRPSGRWGSEVVAVVERGFMPGEAFRQQLAGKLPRAHCPKAWIETDQLPRTSNGKLKRPVGRHDGQPAR